MEGYVVVATFSTEVETKLAQATLSAAGINSYLQYEDTGHMLPVLQQLGGVKLLVAPKDLEEAKMLLTTSPEEESEV